MLCIKGHLHITHVGVALGTYNKYIIPTLHHNLVKGTLRGNPRNSSLISIRTIKRVLFFLTKMVNQPLKRMLNLEISPRLRRLTLIILEVWAPQKQISLKIYLLKVPRKCQVKD